MMPPTMSYHIDYSRLHVIVNMFVFSIFGIIICRGCERIRRRHCNWCEDMLEKLYMSTHFFSFFFFCHQARLSEMKAASESMPTLDQVEQEVLSAEAEMAAAKARKDYRRAAELSVKLPGMHDRHSAVASAIRKAMSRKQLTEEIQRLEGEVRRHYCFCAFFFCCSTNRIRVLQSLDTLFWCFVV